jgi:hypothetical protein
MIYLTTFWVAHGTQPQVKLCLVNNILKRTCMEAIVAQLGYYFGVYLKCLRRTTKNRHDRRSSALYFISGLSDYEARRSDKSIISDTDCN